MTLSNALMGALDRWYGVPGGAPMPSTAQDAASMVAELRPLVGSTDKAVAAATGVGYSTIGFWRRGQRPPSGHNRELLRQAYNRLVSTPRRQAAQRTRPIPAQVAITAVVVCEPRQARYINKTARRTFNAGRGKATFSAVSTVDAWVRGEDPAPALGAAILSAYSEPFGFEGDVEVTLT